MTLHDAAILMIRHSLSPRSAAILSLLATGPRTMQDLTRVCMCTSAGMTHCIDELEKSGLACRLLGHHGDRRKVLVQLTSKGQEKADTLLAEAGEVDFSSKSVQ